MSSDIEMKNLIQNKNTVPIKAQSESYNGRMCVRHRLDCRTYRKREEYRILRKRKMRFVAHLIQIDPLY